MKRFLPLCGLLASLTLVFGADFNAVKIPNVTVTVSDFTLDYSPASREVALRPASGGAIRTGTSDSGGVVTFTRVTPGLYTLTIAAIGLDPLTLQVPNSTDTFAASSLVISAWTPPSGARYAGASANLLALSRRLAIVDDALQLDGVAITGGAGETVWTNASDVALFRHDQSRGDAATARMQVDSYDSFDSPTNGAKVFAIANSSSTPYAIHSWTLMADGKTEHWDLDAEGTLYSQITFTSQGWGQSDSKPFWLAPRYVGTGEDGQTSAYRLGTSHVVTNGFLAEFPNAGTNKFTVDYTGKASAVAGFASTDTTAAISIAATGWTNTFGKNAVVYFDGISVTATVYNNAGTAIYTNATALGGGSILLQPSGKVILSGTSVVGRAAVF